MSETSVVPSEAPAAEGVPPPPDPPRALVPRPQMAIAERGVQLRSFEDLQRFAKMACESGAAPKGMNTVGQVAVAIQAGMEAGLSPMHALQAIVVINGNTSWRGQSALGLIRSNPACRYIKAWTEGEGDAMKGVCVSRRVSGEREERTEFTVQQAVRAGLWGKRGRDGSDTPWTTYPDRQLMWRAVGFHTKDHWSDVLGGFPVDEEVRDYPDDVRAIPSGPSRASLPPPSSPDPLLADVMPPASTAVIDVAASDPDAAPCCGKPHGPSDTCPEAK